MTVMCDIRTNEKWTEDDLESGYRYVFNMVFEWWAYDVRGVGDKDFPKCKFHSVCDGEMPAPPANMYRNKHRHDDDDDTIRHQFDFNRSVLVSICFRLNISLGQLCSLRHYPFKIEP